MGKVPLGTVVCQYDDDDDDDDSVGREGGGEWRF